ncbi:hypothetical protein [Caenispirillum bisanense]|uniref:hypothetical protein n=1 Tax=Caenispirillum bisanense TaxID=414052 RepID=UPI0031D413DB
MPRLRPLTAAALVAAGIALASPAALTAAEQASVTAAVSAQGFAAVPPGQPVEIRIYQASGDDGAVRAATARALAAQGWQVVESGGRIAFSVEVTGDEPLAPEPRSGMLALDGTRGSGESTDRLDARLRLFSTSESSVLTGRQLPAAGSGGAQTRVQADVTDLASGRRLWQGWADVSLAGQTPERVAASLVPLLVEAVGETVRNEARTVPVE